MENKTPELDSKGAVAYNNKIIPQRKENVASEGFKALQRVWAACELFHRGYDIRTDHITYADIQAYWQSQSSAADRDANVDSAGSPDIDLLGISPEAIEAEVAKMIASDAAKAAASATEKPPAKADSAQDNKVSAEKPAAINTPADNGNADNPTRAARRREQRAAKKRPNPVDTANNAADAVNHANEAPNPTDVDASTNPNPTRAERRQQQRAARKAQKPANNASNTPADNDNPLNLGRAERRREQRAARKAQKRAGRHSDAPTGALTPKEQAEAEAFAHPGTRIYSAIIDIDPPKAPNPANGSAHNIPDDP